MNWPTWVLLIFSVPTAMTAIALVIHISLGLEERRLWRQAQAERLKIAAGQAAAAHRRLHFDERGRIISPRPPHDDTRNG